MGVQNVTDQNFDTEVLQSSTPVVVDFWAEWCGPCKAFAPVMDKVATSMAGKVKMVKMNVDESPHTPGKFNIRGIPTLIAFKDGKAVATKVGSMTESQFTEWLSSVA
jgi:thioredoxin 1